MIIFFHFKNDLVKAEVKEEEGVKKEENEEEMEVDETIWNNKETVLILKILVIKHVLVLVDGGLVGSETKWYIFLMKFCNSGTEFWVTGKNGEMFYPIVSLLNLATKL